MHDHDSQSAHSSKDEQIALLTYLISHNESHIEEVHEIAHGVGGQAAERLHEAIELFHAGNQKLIEALDLIKGGAHVSI